MGAKTDQVLKSDQRKKERLARVLGGKCYCCGYHGCLSALEFHHLNPNEKEFGISNNPHIAFTKAVEEIKKCILVCSNCHREIHAGLITLPDNINCYNEKEKIRIEKELYDIKHGKTNYCIDCGKVISIDAKRCKECAMKKRRKVIRPPRGQLKDMIRTMSFIQIGKYFGVSDNAVKKWCDKYKLPRRKQDINNISDDEWALL